MKIRNIIILIILVLAIMLIPNASSAASFEDGTHSIAGIFRAMQSDPNGWIDSNPGYTGGRWGMESKNWSGTALIHRIGGICVGHSTQYGQMDNNGWQTIAKIVTVYGEKKDDINELKLAYLAKRSIDRNETASNAIYKSKIRGWTRWYTTLNQRITPPEDDDFSEANGYASSIKNQCMESKSTDGEGATQQIIYKNGSTFIGPYNFKNKIGNLKEAKIETREGNEIITYKCSKDGENINNLTDVGDYNDNNFYIVVENQAVSSVKKITVTKEYNAIKARIVFTQNMGGQYNGQNIGIFWALDHKNKDKVELPGVPYSQINIKKIDSDTQKLMKGVGIVVKDIERGYIVEGTPATYTDDIKKATIYTTNENGLTEVKNIKNAGTFQMLEVSNENYGYENVSIENPKDLGSVIASLGEKKEVFVANDKQTGILEIKKQDADSNNLMKNVGFKISNGKGTYLVAVDENGKEQAVVTEKIYLGEMKSTTNKEEATLFITGENGLCTIYNIRVGTYTVEEIYLGNEWENYEIDDNYINWSSGENQNKGRTATVTVLRQRSYNTAPESNVVRDNEKIIDDGLYEIVSAVGDSKTMAVDVYSNGYADGTNIQIHNRNQTLAQKFYFKYTGNGYYQITHLGSGKAVDVYKGYSGGNVQIWTPNNSAAQKWKIKPTDDGWYHLEIEATGERLDVVDGATPGVTIQNGINIRTWKHNNSNAQKFKLNTVSTVPEAKENVTNVTFSNTRKYINLSGYVWEDRQLLNDLYDSENDKLLQNVKVRLKDKQGNTVEFKTLKNPDATTDEEKYETHTEINTDADGKYEMRRVLIDKLDEYYIEFEYNGMSYQSVATNLEESNGSKATDIASRDNFNNNFAVIKNNTSFDNTNNKKYSLSYENQEHSSKLIYGENPIYGYQEQKYPINQVEEQYLITANTKDTDEQKERFLADIYSKEEIRKNGMTDIEKINLGVYERAMPDLALVQDIDNIKLNFENTENNSDYNYTYNYNQRFDENKNGFDTNIKYGENYEKTYQREMYTSDILYNMNNPSHLQVNVVYKIGIRNESENLYAKANEIENYYDSRYTVDKITNADGTNVKYAIDNNYNKNGLKKLIITNDKTISPKDTQYIYITYKLDDSSIKDILNGKITLTSATEISAYSSYENLQQEKPCAGIDVDSNPGSMNIEEKSTYEDDSDIVKLDVFKEAGRTINGTIWQDTAIETLLKDTSTDYSKQRKGDGRYIVGENVVKNVKIELIDSNTKEAVKVYSEANPTRDKSITAQVITNNLGEYTITGIIPGKYQIRYTYGNNSVICDTNGNELENVKAENYKSTIYRKGNKAQAEQMNDYWYRTDSTDKDFRLSDAKDEKGIYEYDDGTKEEVNIVDKRTSEGSEDITYEKANKEEKLSYIQANSHDIDVTIDYNGTSGVIGNCTENMISNFYNIDFGIIERPKQRLTVNKTISYVQLMLDNGQTISEGDPRTGQEIKHIKILPDGKLSIELDQELIQSTILKVTYDISVNNKNAEIDYNDSDYYNYGIVPVNNNGWKIATVTRLYDYLSNDLAFDDTNEENTRIWKDAKINKQSVENGLISENAYKELRKYNRILETEEFGTMRPNQEKTVQLVASRILANGDDDFYFENSVEVNALKYRKILDSIPGNYVPSNMNKENDADETNITITIPTGENKNYLPYITLGISVFGLLAAGVIAIKRKVL